MLQQFISLYLYTEKMEKAKLGWIIKLEILSNCNYVYSMKSITNIKPVRCRKNIYIIIQKKIFVSNIFLKTEFFD